MGSWDVLQKWVGQDEIWKRERGEIAELELPEDKISVLP